MKKKITILSIVALSSILGLSSCTDTSSVPSDSTTPPISSDSSNSSSSSSSSSSGGGSVVEDPSDGIIDASESPWNSSLTSMMTTYLGGILPYIDLGDGEIDAEYVKNDANENYRSYIRMIGGNFLPTHLDDAVDSYQEHHWEALTIGDNFYASSDLLHIEVETYRNSNGLFELKAFYEEPYDSSTVSAWDDTTSTLISEHFGRFSIPFVYLATINYESRITEDGALEVTGGKWDDRILSEFRTAFDGWTITDDEEELTTLHASLTDGGNTLNATLRIVNTKAQLTVSFDEAFDATNQTAWSSEITSRMKRSLNDTVLPYVYLGDTYPEIDESLSNERRVVIVGNLWDASIISSAQTAFVADGWEDNSAGAVASFTKSDENNNFEVTIEQNSDGIPQLTAIRNEAYDPSLLTEYPEEIASAFEDKYGDTIDEIPYVYLGTAHPSLNEEIPAKHPEDTEKMVITGGNYDERILEEFKQKFTENLGWYSAIEYTASDSGSAYNNYGDVLGVAIKAIGEHTYKVGLFVLGSEGDQTVYLEINRSNNTGTTASAWSQPTLDNFATVLGDDVIIPYFDTGRDTLEAVIGETAGLELQFIADATTFSYRVFTVIDTLSKKDWNLTIAHNDTYFDDEAWINSISATKEFNGKTVHIDISVSSSYYYRFTMSGTISLDETYDSSKEHGQWSENISSAILNRFNIDLPYIYLGTDNPYIYENDEDGIYRIHGNVLDTELYLNAREVLTSAGFTIDVGESYGNYRVVAEKENNDGNLVTIVIDHEDGHPYLELYLTEVFNPGSASEWDETTATILADNLPSDVTIPYVYLGTLSPSATIDTQNDVTKISIVGGEWNDQVISFAKNNLDSASWPTAIVSDYYSGSYLSSYLLREDNTAIRLKLFNNDDDEIELDVYYDKKPSTASEEATAWEDFPSYYGDSVSETLKSLLNGGELTPFVPKDMTDFTEDDFYISVPYSEYSNKYMSLTVSQGYITPYYVYLAMNFLETDGYTISFDPFMEDEMPGFNAEKTDENGTVKIQFTHYYGAFGNSNNGWRFTVLYLPPLSQFEDVTSWAESDNATISESLDGLELPYVNLGSDPIRVSASDGEVSITGYNYSDEILANIKTAYEEAGWTINEIYIIDDGEARKTLVGYLEENGHIYVLNITINLSSSSATTRITVEMA